MYFLIIAVLQSISLISPLTPVTAIAPLVFVIAVSLVREAVEDSVSGCLTFCSTFVQRLNHNFFFADDRDDELQIK